MSIHLRRSVSRLLVMFLILAVGLGGAGLFAQPAAAQAVNCTLWHTVQRGESLWLIGQQYGVDWREIARVNNLSNPRLIFAGNRLCVNWTGAAPTPVLPETGATPGFVVTGVQPGERINILAQNFPANLVFRVLMGRYSNQPVTGYQAARLATGAGGSFTATLPIPAQLRDEPVIQVRMESETGNWFSYNWFYNQAGGGGGGPLIPDTGQPATPTPTPAPVIIPGTGMDEADRVERLTAGREADVYQGNAGAYFPNVAFQNATIALTRHSPQDTARLRFPEPWMEVRLFDPQGSEQTQVFGLVYIYFNLDSSTRAALDAGNLTLVRYNSDRQQWDDCPTILIRTKNEPYGRAACFASQFGIYGLAVRQ